MANPVGAGVDRVTGLPLAGWPHVEQSIRVIFATAFGARVMRRWFGSLIIPLLGRENIEPTALIRYFTAIYAALTFEPRFALTQIRVLSASGEVRGGKLRLELVGHYRPRAHLGDFTIERPTQMTITVGG